MIELFVRTGLLGEDGIDRTMIDWRPGVTPRGIMARFEAAMPGVEFVCVVDGLRVEGAELDHELRDASQVIVSPITAAVAIPILVQVLITVAISFAISYVMQALAPRPEEPGVQQDRGDDRSPTYAWDGIQTSYGQGLSIPWGYGRHTVGGQVIWSSVVANAPDDDRLRLILALCEGPIHRFGDVPALEINAMPRPGAPGSPGTQIPDHIRINDNLLDQSLPAPGARVWTRPGELDQEPIRGVEFSGVSTTLTPNEALNEIDEEAIFTFAGPDAISFVSLVFAFPAGLYEQDQQGNQTAYSVRLDLSWRRSGDQAWRPFAGGGGGPLTISAASLSPVLRTERRALFAPVQPVAGNVEIRVRRLSPSGGSQVVSQMVWRNVSFQLDHELAYPRIALLGLELEAGARFSGGLPNVTIRCDLKTVRVWDETEGFSPRCWDVPAAPWDFHAHSPGRNPAWVLLDFLTAPWGLGRWLAESDIDLPAFRRWAAFCDEDPNPADPWSEPSFTVDLVGDRPRPAWEWVIAICAAGRAAPTYRNGKVSVVYQYRDSHGDGGITVPAKQTVQLFTSGNVQDLQVTWLPKANRPTAYLFQFLNEDQNHAQDVLPVQDDESTVDDPASLLHEQWRPETIQAWGVTRPQQCYREGVWRHRVQRLIRREVSFRTGPWALAAEIGDLITLEHEGLRPFGDDQPLSVTVLVGGEDVTDLIIDHDYSTPSGPSEIVVRDPDGAPQRRAITAVGEEEFRGRAATRITVDAAVTVASGAPGVVGLVDNLAEDYEIVSITIEKDMRRQVRALQWVPEVYDPIDQADWHGAGNTGAVLRQPPLDDPTPAADLLVVPLRDGSHRIGWTRQARLRGRLARIYLREEGQADWALLGTTETDSWVHSDFRPGGRYQVSVAIENLDGVPPSPEQGALAVFAAAEFAPFSPPPITNARALVLDDYLLLQWDELGMRDVVGYEVRVGSCWTSAPVLWRGREARALLGAPPWTGSLLVAAQSSSGLYGQPVVVAAPRWSPPFRVEVASLTEFPGPPAGTHSSTEFADGAVQLVAGALTGTYTAPVVDIGYQGPAYWQVRVDREELELATVDDLDFAVDSGEARWWTVHGRPASPARPGSDWQTTVDDLAMTIDDLPETLLVAGHLGETGSHSRVLVETRFEVGGIWTEWAEHQDRTVVARKAQVRLTLDRAATRYSPRLIDLQVGAWL